LFGKVIIVPWQPSSEGFLVDFARVLKAKLPMGVSLHHLLLRETPTSFAEWYADDNP
ncbi:MAG: 6-carboxytetrahydropterin synthase QueD, partial [Bacteroidetes bacterium HGW-Bacteroidetes-22]